MLTQQSVSGVTNKREQFDQLAAGEQIKNARIEVAKPLRGVHPLVSQANQELQSSCTNEQGMMIGGQ